MIKKCKQNSEKATCIKNRMKIEQSRIKLNQTQLGNRKESRFIRVGTKTILSDRMNVGSDYDC